MRYDEVLRLVLVTVRVTTDDDGLSPSGNDPGNALAQDRLPEHGAAEDVPNRPVRTQPHLL